MLPGYNTITPTKVQLVSVSYTKVASPRLLFELRFGCNRFDEDVLPGGRDFDPSSIGLNTGVTSARTSACRRSASPAIRAIGANTSLPRGRVDKNWQLFGNVS